MEITRKAIREAQEANQRFRSRQETLLDWELIDEKLTHLLAFIGHLKQTPIGTVEIQSRVKRFGRCERSKGETSAEFYPKLRHWLDRDVPRTKPPRHKPRQNEEV